MNPTDQESTDRLIGYELERDKIGQFKTLFMDPNDQSKIKPGVGAGDMF